MYKVVCFFPPWGPGYKCCGQIVLVKTAFYTAPYLEEIDYNWQKAGLPMPSARPFSENPSDNQLIPMY